jgi:hypothetical protein
MGQWSHYRFFHPASHNLGEDVRADGGTSSRGNEKHAASGPKFTTGWLEWVQTQNFDTLAQFAYNLDLWSLDREVYWTRSHGELLVHIKLKVQLREIDVSCQQLILFNVLQAAFGSSDKDTKTIQVNSADDIMSLVTG